MTGGVLMKTMKTRHKLMIAACLLGDICFIAFWLFQLSRGNYGSIIWLVYSAFLLVDFIYMAVKKDPYFKGFFQAGARNAYHKYGAKMEETLPYEAFVVLIMLALFVVAAISLFLLY